MLLDLRSLEEGGALYLYAASATQAQVVRQSRLVNLSRQATQTSAAFISKLVARTRVAAQTTAAVLIRTTNLTRLAVQSVVVFPVRQAQIIRIVTQAQSALLAQALKVILRTILATQAQVVVLAKAVSTSRFAVQAQQAISSRQTAIVKVATQAAVAVQSRLVNLTRIATQAQTALLTTVRTYVRTLLATQATVVTLAAIKVILRTVLATQAQVATIVRDVALSRVLTQAQAAVSIKQTQLSRAMSQSQTAFTSRLIALTRTIGQAQAATLSATKVFLRTLLATQASVATLSTIKVILRSLGATQAMVAVLSKSALINKAATQGAVAVSKRAVAITRAATQGSAVAQSRFISAFRRAVQATRALLATFNPNAARPRELSFGASRNLTQSYLASVVGPLNFIASQYPTRSFTATETQIYRPQPESPDTVPTLIELKARVTAQFFTQETFPGITTLYVNGDTGLDSNDGSAAHPLRSLSAAALNPQIGPFVQVIISPMSGSYAVPDGGMVMVGATDQPVIVRGAYGGNKPVIDARPFSNVVGAGLNDMPSTLAQIRVRQVFDISGTLGRLDYLDIRYGFRHNPVFRGTRGMLRNCHLVGAFEDAIKITGSVEDPRAADIGWVIGNDVEGYASGGVDLTYAASWLIEQNRFHDPQVDPVTGLYVAIGVGMKVGAMNIIVAQNTIENIPGDINHSAIELGATGSNFDMATDGCVATDNIITGFNGVGVAASSAVAAEMYRNVVTNCLIGLTVGLDEDIHATLPNTPFCEDARLARNVITPSLPNGVFLRLASLQDGTGFSSEENVYHTSLNRFLKQSGVVDWVTFKAWSGTDSTSTFV